jgi:hypothetical protein
MVQFGGKSLKKTGIRNVRNGCVSTWDLKKLIAMLFKLDNWGAEDRLPLGT